MTPKQEREIDPKIKDRIISDFQRMESQSGRDEKRGYRIEDELFKYMRRLGWQEWMKGTNTI